MEATGQSKKDYNNMLRQQKAFLSKLKELLFNEDSPTKQFEIIN